MGVLKKAVKAVKGVFSPDIPAPEKPPNPNKELREAEAEAARKLEEERRRRAKYGHGSTYGTSRFGLTEDAKVKKRTLLGG